MKLQGAVALKMRDRLDFIYKEKLPPDFVDRLIALVEENIHKPASQFKSKWSERDTILITYGDSVKTENERPLETLNKFLKANLKSTISCVHILPFFPFSSDDGFSVVDYVRVNPELGNWKDVRALSKNFDLMVDLVVNHISQKSEWFQNYLAGKEAGKDYFIEVDRKTDLFLVTRPRSLPLLSPYETVNGTKHLWTTFSADQIDLNFANPELLLEMLKVLIFYVKQGARMIRLDAIAFLWKEIGTTCLHLPETHEVVKLMRDVLEAVDPRVVVLTETNVPNKENLSYFGAGDEAHMVYQFSLPPLLLHALHTGNSEYLNKWARSVPDMGPDCTFFNFTASHDGIGVRPLEGLLPQNEFDTLLENMKKQGHISTKSNPDGSASPYEMNITYFDALKATGQGADALQVERFICSQTITMTLQGVPAFYIHSMTATSNYLEGVAKTGRARTINRKKWDAAELNGLLTTDTVNAQVFNELKRRIQIRQRQALFHPNCPQKIHDFGRDFFVVERTSRAGTQKLLAISNMTSQTQSFNKPAGYTDLKFDLISGEDLNSNSFELASYRVVWLIQS